MSSCETVMKCPRYDGVERSPTAAESRVLHLKEPPTLKPQCPPHAGVTSTAPALPPSLHNTRAVHDKENSADGTLDEGFEDSGYLSLHNSQIDEHPGEPEEDRVQKKTATTPNGSPSKCQGRPPSLEASTPVDRLKRRTLSSTPSDRHRDPNLPILKFQRAVCEELTRSYQKNKRYDWSVVAKVAEHHLLDRVIGGKMGREYVDVFSCLLSRSMRSILGHVLSLLGDLDLISCKKVSRTWRRIICEDRAARSRCQRAEQVLRESSSSLRQRGCGLTRDVSVSRVVLSCIQTLASSSTPSPSSSSSSSSSSSCSSSSTPSCRLLRRTAVSQKGGVPTPPCTRFSEYLQAAGGLKLHESLRPCRRCGSPATHSSEAQRATCTRLNCRFDFCSCCGGAFHGSTPCRVVRPRPHPSVPSAPGSRSKRSIRRL